MEHLINIISDRENSSQHNIIGKIIQNEIWRNMEYLVGLYSQFDLIKFFVFLFADYSNVTSVRCKHVLCYCAACSLNQSQPTGWRVKQHSNGQDDSCVILLPP